MKNRLLAAFLFAALATPSFAVAQEALKPTPEHQQLTAQAGTWNAVIEMMGQDGKPEISKGTSVIKVGPAGLWVIDDFDAVMGQSPFAGHGTTGYDPTTGKYVGTWIDSWSPKVMVLEGTADKDGKVLTMKGMAPGMDGKPVEHTMVTTTKDANTRVFEMFLPGPDGKAMKIMTITYTRAAGKSDKK